VTKASWTRAGAVAAALALAVAIPSAAQTPPDVLRTAPEKTDYVETTRYEDVVAFVEAAAAQSPRMHVTTMGYTFEGRALPLVVVGDVANATPEAVLASGRTRVYLQGNIHAGEVEGKESLLMLLREFAQGRHAQLLDSLVVLVLPIYNADGNERVRLTNRGSQHGPIGGMGQRPNAQDYDLNRDHMKLDSPEARSLALMMQRYDPHVGVDLHTTNGTRHAYHLTYSVPMHPNTDSALVRFMRDRWLPTMTRAIKDEHGWDYYYYGNLQGQGEERGWYTFDYRPRFNNNYLGLRNRMAILSEAYSYATFEERIQATSWFVEEILDFAYRNASAIRTIVAAADAAPIAGRQLALRADYERSGPVEILMGDVEQERNPYTGAVMLRRVDVRTPTTMPEFGTYTPTETTRAPRAYLVLPEQVEVMERLRAHGVLGTVLTADQELEVERFRIDSTTVAQREFQGHQERTLFGAYERATVTVPSGTLVVPTNQPLGRLAFTLLEPRSDDGLLNWNVLDRRLEGQRFYPILRTDALPDR
jgi:Zinc carboxypeptidase